VISSIRANGKQAIPIPNVGNTCFLSAMVTCLRTIGFTPTPNSILDWTLTKANRPNISKLLSETKLRLGEMEDPVVLLNEKSKHKKWGPWNDFLLETSQTFKCNLCNTQSKPVTGKVLRHLDLNTTAVVSCTSIHDEQQNALGECTKCGGLTEGIRNVRLVDATRHVVIRVARNLSTKKLIFPATVKINNKIFCRTNIIRWRHSHFTTFVFGDFKSEADGWHVNDAFISKRRYEPQGDEIVWVYTLTREDDKNSSVAPTTSAVLRTSDIPFTTVPGKAHPPVGKFWLKDNDAYIEMEYLKTGSVVTNEAPRTTLPPTQHWVRSINGAITTWTLRCTTHATTPVPKGKKASPTSTWSKGGHRFGRCIQTPPTSSHQPAISYPENGIERSTCCCPRNPEQNFV